MRSEISTRIKQLALIFILLIAPSAITLAQPAGAIVPGTLGEFEKPNQNRLFFHDNIWWLAARSADDKDWYLWKYENSIWTKTTFLDGETATRPDCFVDSDDNKLYIALAHTKTSAFLRLSYTGDKWEIDDNYPTQVQNFAYHGDNPLSMGVTSNGEIWLFQLENFSVVALYSIDAGLTWSRKLTLKTGLSSEDGLTDAAVFTNGGIEYVGVAYGENTTSISQFGFVQHQVGQPESNWTDETAIMGQFAGTEADDHVATAVGANGDVYIVVKTDGGGNGVAANGLYKRSSDGWSKFNVNKKPGGNSWTRPAISIDESNNQLYLFGTLEANPKIGEYKTVPIGQEDLLADEPAVILFKTLESDDFKNLSVPAHTVNYDSDLMVAVENSTRKNIWYNKINIDRINKAPVAIAQADLPGGIAPVEIKFTGSASLDPDGTIVSYAWDFGDNSGTSTSADPVYTYATAGIFQASLVVTDSDGAQDTTTVRIVVTAPIPPNAIALVNKTSGKVPLTVSFDASTSSDPDNSIASFKWEFGDGTPDASGQKEDHTYQLPGVYPGKLIVTDQSTLSDTAYFEITVLALQPPVALAASNLKIGNLATTFQFTGSSSTDSDGTIIKYAWDFGDGSTSTLADPTYSYSATGTYTVSLTVTDDDARTASSIITINIIEAVKPTAVATADIQSGFAPVTVQFTGSNSTDLDGTVIAYNWDFGDDSGASSEKDPAYSFTTAGSYKTRLVIFDNTGLTDTAYVQIEVKQNSIPVAKINTPAADTTILRLANLAFSGSADDSEDGSLPASNFVWSLLNSLNSESIIVTNSKSGKVQIAEVGDYRLVLKVNDSQGSFSTDTLRLKVVHPTGVNDLTEAGTIPSAFKLSNAYPNPFHASRMGAGQRITIQLTMPQNTPTTVRVFDYLGREVAVLAENTPFAAGTHSLEWNGRGKRGELVSTGVYFIRVFAGRNSSSQKLLIIGR